MPFEYKQKVLFKYCDPAGIVFYPRYLEMVNDCMEDFFARIINWPYETMLQTAGIPTVKTNTEFQAPSYHGDVLIFSMNIEKIGRSSLTMIVNAYCENEQRLSNSTTLVHIDGNGKSALWPNEIRASLQSYKDECDDT